MTEVFVIIAAAGCLFLIAAFSPKRKGCSYCNGKGCFEPEYGSKVRCFKCHGTGVLEKETK